jgi:hypothetical protein
MVIGCFISCYADLLALQQKYWALGKPARNKGFVDTAGILHADSAVCARHKEMALRDVKILGRQFVATDAKYAFGHSKGHASQRTGGKTQMVA